LANLNQLNSKSIVEAILADVQVPEYIAGCKALGLINKLITGPLWQVL